MKDRKGEWKSKGERCARSEIQNDDEVLKEKNSASLAFFWHILLTLSGLTFFAQPT